MYLFDYSRVLILIFKLKSVNDNIVLPKSWATDHKLLNYPTLCMQLFLLSIQSLRWGLFTFVISGNRSLTGGHRTRWETSVVFQWFILNQANSEGGERGRGVNPPLFLKFTLFWYSFFHLIPPSFLFLHTFPPTLSPLYSTYTHWRTQRWCYGGCTSCRSVALRY